MRQFLFGLSISVAFIVGCLASQLSQAAIKTARAGTPAQKWEYFCYNGIVRPWNPEDAAKLNLIGKDGWEMVQQLVGVNGANYDVYCFKRPL